MAFLARFGGYLEEHHDELAERIVDETYSSVAAYEHVPRDDFLAATRTTVAFTAQALVSRRLPTESDWDWDEETVRRRVRQGILAKDWIAHGRVFLEVMHAAAIRFAEDESLEEREVMAGLVVMDEMGQTSIAFAGEAFDAVADELLREDEVERREFMAGLLQGALTPAAMRSGAAAIGLDPDRLYRAVRIRPLAREGAAELLRLVLRGEPTVDPRGAWTGMDGDVCGITQDGPPAELGGATAGVGPAVSLEAAASSYAIATTAVETACRFDLSGAHTIADLGALPMVAGGGHAGDALVERLVHSVERNRSSGRALVETVAAYLQRGLQAGVTAEALHLHPNSLRKRLRRYEELTGADLSSMDDLVAVWWALKRRELDARQTA